MRLAPGPPRECEANLSGSCTGWVRLLTRQRRRDSVHMGAAAPEVKTIRAIFTIQLRSVLSIQIVTGPSLTRLTAMSAPNSPVATGRPISRKMFEKCK